MSEFIPSSPLLSTSLSQDRLYSPWVYPKLGYVHLARFEIQVVLLIDSEQVIVV